MNVGSSDRATFIRKVALSHFQPCIRAATSASTAPCGTRRSNSSSRVDAGDNSFRAISFAAGNHARRPPIRYDQLLDRRVEKDIDPGFAAGPRHRLSDRAHSADGMAPGARNARRLAEQMVKQNIGGPGRLRRSKIADDSIEAEQRLGKIALEMAIEDFATRFERRSRGRSGFRRATARPCRGRGSGASGIALTLRPTLGGARKSHFLSKPNDRLELGDVAIVSFAIGLVSGARFPCASGRCDRRADSRRRQEGNCRFSSARPSAHAVRAACHG